MHRSPGDCIHNEFISSDEDDRSSVSLNESLDVKSKAQIQHDDDSEGECCENDSCKFCWTIGSESYNDEDELCAPLTAEHVRWFRKDDYGTKWIDFNGYDSQRLECAYRRITIVNHQCRHCSASPKQRKKKCSIAERKASTTQLKDSTNHKVLNGDTKTMLTNGGGDILKDTVEKKEELKDEMIVETKEETPTTPTNHHSPIVIDDSSGNSSPVTPPISAEKSSSSQSIDADNFCINVCGGLYEVNVKTRVYSPLYWSPEGETRKVTRGVWFYETTWQPLEEEFSEVIEREHLELFSSRPLDGDTDDAAAGEPTPLDEFDFSVPAKEPQSPLSTSSSTVEFHRCSASSSGECIISTSPPTLPPQSPQSPQSRSTSPSRPRSSRPTSPRPNSSRPTSPRPTSPSASAIHSVSFRDFYVDWNREDEVYLHYDTASSKLYRVVGSKLGLSKGYVLRIGTKLYRGYQKQADDTDKRSDISHLVFVVHGIGQMMATNDIIKSCSELRVSGEKMQEKFFPSLEKDCKRIEFLPVEWRSSLKLDGGLVDSVTPVQLKGLRQMLNTSALDILYYSSPLHRAEMIRGLVTELNRLYVKFCELQPNFVSNGGKVSIVAHSLGCVIMYDILTNWDPLHIYDQFMGDLISESKNDTDLDDSETELITELDSAKKRIADIEAKLKDKRRKKSGSPLSVFLALRKSPVDKSYRLEPLILNHYARIKPLTIHQHDSKTKPHYDSMITETCPLASTSNTSVNQVDESVPQTSVPTTPSTEAEPSSTASWGSLFSWSRLRSTSFDTAAVDATPSPPVVVDLTKDGADNWLNLDPLPDDVIDLTDDRLDYNDDSISELPFRLDYVLRDSGTMGQAYLAALTAHIRYWADWDVALFILTHVFGDEYPVKSS